MGGALLLAASGWVVLLGACSSSSGDDGGPESSGAVIDTAPGGAGIDVAALHLEGRVDQVVVMVRPNGAQKPPDATMAMGGTLVGARHVLRAPRGDGGMLDLWIVRIRNPQMGPGIQECRVMDTNDGSTSATCSAPGQAAPPGGNPPLVQGLSSDGSSSTLDLGGPADMTHFIVAAGDRRIAVIPVDGQAVLFLDGACPAETKVAAWRGDEQIREEQAQLC